jgi:putative transposase
MVNVRTIKLKVYVIGDNKKAAWARIYQISNDVWRAANWVVGGQYWNDLHMRRVYARKGIDPKDMEAVGKAEKEFFDKCGYFGVKRQATTERDIKEAFPNLPPCITNPMNQVVVASYSANKKDMLLGKQTLRTYKEGMPFIVTKSSIQFAETDGDHIFTWKIKKGESLQFGIVYGRDRANYKLTMERILDGTYDYGTPQFELRKGDLYLSIPVQEPVKSVDLNTNKSVGVDLGIAIPAYISTTDGVMRKAIGSADEFTRVRGQMQARLRNTQHSLNSASGGHGRKRKTKAIVRYKNKERNFAKRKNHEFSRQVVDFAIKTRAGIIKLELLEGIGQDRKNCWILRNWSWAELQTMIAYKAKRYGIEVVKVDPYLTSQTCSKCGHYEKGQRPEQRKFICKGCGNKMNADYNAAINIARSKKIVTKKEQCEIHRAAKTA